MCRGRARFTDLVGTAMRILLHGYQSMGLIPEHQVIRYGNLLLKSMSRITPNVPSPSHRLSHNSYPTTTSPALYSMRQAHRLLERVLCPSQKFVILSPMSEINLQTTTHALVRRQMYECFSREHNNKQRNVATYSSLFSDSELSCASLSWAPCLCQAGYQSRKIQGQVRQTNNTTRRSTELTCWYFQCQVQHLRCLLTKQ